MTTPDPDASAKLGDAANAAGGATPPAAPDAGTPPVVDVESLKAENARLQAKVKATNDEAMSRRHAANEERDAKLKALEEKGEYAEALKLRDQKLNELAPDAADAAAWREHLKSQSEKIAAELEGDLPAFVKTAVSAAGSLDAKREILDGYRASLPNAPVPPPAAKPPAGGGPPPAGGTTKTVDELLSEGVSAADIKRNHPDAYKATREGRGSSAKSQNPFFR